MASKKQPSSAPAAVAEEVAFYLVVDTLIHGELVDGHNVVKRYEVGDEIELTAAQAAPLLGRALAPKPATEE